MVEASEFHVGIWFPSEPSYCRHADAFHVLTWLYPQNIFHPNIRPPFLCARIRPATELCDLLYTLFEMITYSNWASHDGLNADACQWARNHQDRFPIDRRPLKRRVLDLRVKADHARGGSEAMNILLQERETPVADYLQQQCADALCTIGHNHWEFELPE